MRRKIQSLRSKKIVKTMDSYINENKYTKNEEVINMMSRRIINMNEFNMEWMQLKWRFKDTKKRVRKWRGYQYGDRGIVNINEIHMEWM